MQKPRPVAVITGKLAVSQSVVGKTQAQVRKSPCCCALCLGSTTPTGSEPLAAIKPILAAVLVMGTAYAAYPYVTLYRLGHAVQSGDAGVLRSLVNWPEVRAGIKQDICDHIGKPPLAEKVSDSLPPFGASFARGIATKVVEQTVTARHLVEITRREEYAAGAEQRSPHVSWAFFAGPTEFIADLDAPGENAPIRLQLTLRSGGWQVTRIWLPHGMLREANGT
jgi:hypothetical protein